MPQPTHAEVINITQEFIDGLLHRVEEAGSRLYHPGLHCYDAVSGVNRTGDAVWTVFLGKAFPGDDGLRLELAEHLYDRLGIGSDVALEW